MNLTLKTLSVIALCAAFSLNAQQPSTAAKASTGASDPAPPAHPATPEQIREFLTVTDYVPNAHKMMSQMLASSRASAGARLPADFWDDMDKSLQQLDLTSAIVPAYQKYFSQSDMAATLTFYKSPAGKQLLAAQPYISSTAGDVLRNAGRTVSQQVYARHKDEIDALQKSQSAPDASAPSATPAQPSQAPK